MSRLLVLPACALLLGSFLYAQQPVPPAPALPKAETYWNVDDIKPGMKGEGKTVMKGVKIDTFNAEVIGVLKNTSPGRDMILCRLSGLDLDKSGVIQGMSGSPIYVQGKLLGAVAYAWAFGKEPIAGVTPFAQMVSFAAAHERREIAEEKKKPARIGLSRPILIDGREFKDVTISDDHREPTPTAADGMWLMPLKTPVMTTGMSARSLAVLRDHFKDVGLVPMQGGGVASNIPTEERNINLAPGSALSLAMITGDFDMSGIGTVTHVEGKRVYGFGHPFMGLGSCDLPMMTGYTHTIYPRVSISFKIGSPLRIVGVINADTSTCIAGVLDRQPDMMPLTSTLLREPNSKPQTYNVKIARMRGMIGPLVQAALTNSVDMEGNFPDEMSAHIKARIEIEGHDPLIIDDWFAGPMLVGDRAPQALYAPIGMLVQQLGNNSFDNLRFKSIEVATEIQPGRRTAEIESCELASDTLSPGETLKATVTLRPYKGQKQRVNLEVALPADIAEGSYTALIGDDLNNARADLRDNPHLGMPQNIDRQFEMIRLQLAAKRTNLVMRVRLNGGAGVATGGKTLPNLPPSMVQILSSSKKTNTQTLYSALVTRAGTSYVIQGTDTLRFQVTKNKRVSN
ncbi:MAG: SpoIVB peptidase S55 [Planctomycetes bacterium]|nr:SpoIVB peptidase S55 [Planctomycetota bacterium]